MDWQPIETAPSGIMVLCCDVHATKAENWAFVGWNCGDPNDSNKLLSEDGCVRTPHRMARPATHWVHLKDPPGYEF